MDGGGFCNNDVYVIIAIVIVIVNAMHSSNSSVMTDVDYYDYEYIQYAQSSRHFMNYIFNEHCRNVEGRKWFQIWLLYFYGKTKTRHFFTLSSSLISSSSSDCLQQIVAGAAVAETTESSNIQNVLVSSPSLYSLSIQAICNVLKMKLNNIACVNGANGNEDIDMSLLYDSMSHLNSSCNIGCNNEISRNKCSSFNNNNTINNNNNKHKNKNDNQIKQCARSGQVNVETTLLHTIQSQLLIEAQINSVTYTETKTKTKFAQHINRQLPLPPPTTPSSISQTITTTTESSLSPLSLYSSDSVAMRYLSNQPVINQTKTNNNYNNNNINKNKHSNKRNNNKNDTTRNGDWEKSAKRSNIRERFTRQRFKSETSFASLTSLFIDLRKMFITFLLPLILLCKMLPMSCAGEYTIRFCCFVCFLFFILLPALI